MNQIAGAQTSRVDSAGVPVGIPNPAGFHLDLPLPPSVNRFKRTKAGTPLGNRSPEVKQWRRACDGEIYQMLFKPKPVLGDFEIEVIWDRSHKKPGHKSRFDIDNRIKALLDWLQSRELIENDGYCERKTVYWGRAPRGCVVIVKGVGI